ncbi:MAG: thiaminase II, partial [bacterium]
MEKNWQQQIEHPFVSGIGDGNLDVDTFTNWIR